MSSKEIILSYLSEDTPRTQRELETMTGIDRRQVRDIIGLLRDDGIKICSGNKGFWLWNGKDDSYEKTMATMRRKSISTLRRLARMGALPLEGQITIAELLEVSA